MWVAVNLFGMLLAAVAIENLGLLLSGPLR